jgi:acyl-coenzyme A thioesterase PaaI-like protein
MDIYELIRTQMIPAVPFAAHTGIELLEIGPGRAVTRLQQQPETSNHLGTMHAGALFTLGEAASGGAMSGTFAEQILSVRPVATAAQITYSRAGRGTLKADAHTSKSPGELQSTLRANGRVSFDIEVTISDAAERSIATMVVAWQVRASHAA